MKKAFVFDWTITRIARKPPLDYGIETIEWIAIAAVILALLLGVLTVMSPGGQAIATQMLDQMMGWVDRWSGGVAALGSAAEGQGVPSSDVAPDVGGGIGEAGSSGSRLSRLWNFLVDKWHRFRGTGPYYAGPGGGQPMGETGSMAELEHRAISELDWRVPIKGTITCTQGYGAGTHWGIDLDTEETRDEYTQAWSGTPVYAAVTGRVVETGHSPYQKGHYVIIQVGPDYDPIFVEYQHLLSHTSVTVGQEVHAGTTVIGEANGDPSLHRTPWDPEGKWFTGNSTGSHLHLEVRRDVHTPKCKDCSINPESFVGLAGACSS